MAWRTDAAPAAAENRGMDRTTTFAAHFAQWTRANSRDALAAAVQRWENEGGSVKPAADAAAPRIPR